MRRFRGGRGGPGLRGTFIGLGRRGSRTVSVCESRYVLRDRAHTEIVSGRPANGGLTGAMAKQANFSVVRSDTRVNRGRTDPARGFSWSDPEEGYRLMRAFLNIREPALRDAIITFVAEVSKLHHDEQ